LNVAVDVTVNGPTMFTGPAKVVAPDTCNESNVPDVALIGPNVANDVTDIVDENVAGPE